MIATLKSLIFVFLDLNPLRGYKAYIRSTVILYYNGEYWYNWSWNISGILLAVLIQAFHNLILFNIIISNLFLPAPYENIIFLRRNT